VELHDQRIFAVDGLNRPFALDVILKDDIIDVYFDNRRCLINRCRAERSSAQLHGDRLFFFALNADVVFDAIEVRPLL